MWLASKSKAFTLAEVIIGIAIMAVVVGLSYIVIVLVVKNSEAIGANYKANTEIALLEQRLALDLNSYTTFRFSKMDEELWCSSPLDSVRYRFLDGAILRGADTLIIGNLQKEFYLSGKGVESGYIDALKLLFPSNDRAIFLSRKNDATTLLSVNGIKN